MSAKTATPSFIYGRPVRPGEFLNREAELRTIFNRLRNEEFTAAGDYEGRARAGRIGRSRPNQSALQINLPGC
jgi:hypothetical protein